MSHASIARRVRERDFSKAPALNLGYVTFYCRELRCGLVRADARVFSQRL
jgi:hypothetical protein